MFHLVTGGSGSGKSAFAETTICEMQKQTGAKHLYYIATMYPYGKETKEKILRHKQMRDGKGFETIERYTNLSGLAEEEAYFGTEEEQEGICVLLECMSNLVANERYLEDGCQTGIAKHVIDGIHKLNHKCQGLVVVTNEVFSEGNVHTEEMEEYICTLGNINVQMAKQAEKVSEIVYGIEVKIKS